jgi:putative transposase
MPTKSELKYHIVWCTKYRRKFLQEEEQKYLKRLIKDKCKDNKYTLLAIEIMPDHVHVFIEASGRDSVHRIVSQLKGFTSFELKKEFPKLIKRVPAIWTRSYYASTVGHVSEDTVLKYIENQKNN